MVALVATAAITISTIGGQAAGQTAQGFRPASQPFTIDEFGFPQGLQPYGVALGPDGRVWTTVAGGGGASVNQIGAIDPQSLQRTSYKLPTADVPSGLTAGPDGAMWFTEFFNDRIGRITTSGVVTTYPVSAHSAPNVITTGPDGNLWFSESGRPDQGFPAAHIGTMKPDGTGLVEYSLTSGSAPVGITTGPDGALWFAERGTTELGRITTTGSISEVDLPAPQTTVPTDVVTGPDGALWITRDPGASPPDGLVDRYDVTTKAFKQISLGPNTSPSGITSGGGRLWVALSGTNQVVSLSPDGSLTETVPLAGDAAPQYLILLNGDVWVTEPNEGRLARIQHRPSPFQVRDLPNGSNPVRITAGPDGNMWFTANGTNDIDRLTPTGELTTFHVPTQKADPWGIAAGPDGALWFTELDGNKVGRVTTTGEFREFPLPHANSHPRGIAAGPDGRVWFAENADRIGAIKPDGSDFAEYDAAANSDPFDITAGSDGRLWFTQLETNKVAAIEPTGAHTITQYLQPGTPNATAITTGADGRTWYAGSNNNTIGAVTTKGAVTSFITTPHVIDVAVGPDKQIWAGYPVAGKVGVMAADGYATDHEYVTGNVEGVAAGPDGALWFTWSVVSGQAQIVRLPVVAPPAPVPLTPVVVPSPVVTPSPVATPVGVTPAFTG